MEARWGAGIGVTPSDTDSHATPLGIDQGADDEGALVCLLLPPSQEVRLQAHWAQLQALALDSYEVSSGIVVDLPATRYDDVIQLVERQLDICGMWIDLTLRRQGDRLLLTATATELAGQSLLRSMTRSD